MALLQPMAGPTRHRQPVTPPVDPQSDELKGPTQIRKLTQKEIERIRFLELRGARLGKDSPPDSVTVKLDSKVADEFLVAVEGNPAYTGERARAEFRKQTAAQKVHIIAAEIAAERRAEFADKIRITSDPEVFVEFRKRVMPTILQSCATVGCHGPGGAENAKFYLFKDPKRSADSTYANFIMLNDLEVGQLLLLNRSQPANSLLVTYMLPTKDVKPELRHPGNVEYRPPFQSRTAPGLRRIENWIASLKHPADDYRVHLIGRQASSQPALEPDGPPPSPGG